jgi:hypothetical protein
MLRCRLRLSSPACGKSARSSWIASESRGGALFGRHSSEAFLDGERWERSVRAIEETSTASSAMGTADNHVRSSAAMFEAFDILLSS